MTVEEYTCDRCLMRVEEWRVVSVRKQHDSVIVEHYCECLPELRVSVFDNHEAEVDRLTAGAPLPHRRKPSPIPQYLVDREVAKFAAFLAELPSAPV